MRQFRPEMRRSGRLVLFNGRAHWVFSFRDDRTVGRHLSIQRRVIGPFCRKIILVENRGRRTFWDACFAIDAFFRMNKKHRFAFVETFYGANGHTIGVLAVETGFCHHVCHRELTFPENLMRCKVGRRIPGRGSRASKWIIGSQEPPSETHLRAAKIHRQESHLANSLTQEYGT